MITTEDKIAFLKGISLYDTGKIVRINRQRYDGKRKKNLRICS